MKHYQETLQRELLRATIEHNSSKNQYNLGYMVALQHTIDNNCVIDNAKQKIVVENANKEYRNGYFCALSWIHELLDLGSK